MRHVRAEPDPVVGDDGRTSSCRVPAIGRLRGSPVASVLAVRNHPFVPLRHRAVRLLWTAAVISDVGTWVQLIVVGTLVDRLFSVAGALGAKSVGIAGGVSANRRLRADAIARHDHVGRQLLAHAVRGDDHPEMLVDGVAVQNDVTGRKLKFLRRIPVDPMTHSTDWGKRSYQDNADATRWGGQNVFDVYTTFEGTALDGTKYRDW